MSDLRTVSLTLTRQDIVCFSSIDWDFIWQGHQEIMAALAEQGNRVLFIENTGVRPPTLADLPRLKKRWLNWMRSVRGFRQERENLYVYSPLILPFPYSRVSRVINRFLLLRALRRWMRAVGFRTSVFFTFLPTPLALDVMERLHAAATVYYCIDNLAKSSFLARRIRKTEVQLLSRVDLVFVTSELLYQFASAHHSNVSLFPFGVNFTLFEKVRLSGDQIPEEMRELRRPRVGYIGGVHKWIDQELLAGAARRLPETTFVLVGPIQTDVSRLRECSNVVLLGPKAHARIPGYVKAFDVGLIPYRLTGYTDHVYPTKLNEYLALGIPVVSTGIPEVRKFNDRNGKVVTIAEDADDFVESIQAALHDDTPERRHERVEAARRNSWEEQIKEMSRLIATQIERNRQAETVGWEERLLRFYRATSRRVLASVIPIVVAYLLLFETPMLWLLARPLAISDPPGGAEAILVLGHGVGESSQAGEGSFERVKHAVDLYNQGHARRIIFASAYRSTFPEAEVMKALAVSLGVSPSAVLLEDRAASTYEYARFAGEILDRHGWRSILLVSSRYHMRRASLTFQKNVPRVRVIHTPVPHSAFYAHTWGATPPQFRAILKEYAGIAYYRWKGWL